MKKKIILHYLVMSVLSIYSCNNCELWGDYNLGNEFTLLEGDKLEDRNIIYCTSKKKPSDCCYSGIPILPKRDDRIISYVQDVKYNDKSIIAKCINFDKTIKYYFIDKKIDTSWEYDDGGIFYNRIQNHVYGPFELEQFKKILVDKNIDLRFENNE